MRIRRTLVRESMLFLAAVVAALSLGAFLISSRAMRSALGDLFRQRLERAQIVLAQYTQARYLTRLGELESVLTSPRLLAALETGDPATIAEEVPTHLSLMEADVVRIADVRGRDVYFTEGLPEPVKALVREAGQRVEERIGLTHLTFPHGVYDLVAADITANNGALLGRITVGRILSTAYAQDLRRLTGFDILLALDGVVVAESVSPAMGENLRPLAGTPPHEITRLHVDGEEFMVYRADDATSGLSVIFAGSLDGAIAPMMARVLGLLLGLAIAGAAMAMALAWIFMSRRVGRQVNHLVRSAERIAKGDLDFRISRGSSDELGHLAGELENMRSQLATNRQALLQAHQDRLNSERMAALGQMATGIIHDFKNPMTVVQGTADLIAARDPADAKLARQCDVIHRHVDRMAALTRDVIEYANGRSVLDVETVAISSFIREIQEGHVEPCSRSGVKLQLDGPDDMSVLVDPSRLRRVVDNIVNNAREVSRVGDTVTIRWAGAEDGGVCLEIEDQGPGIPADLVDRIFEPFVTEGKVGGSGLGLAIARKIVEDHGATLDVKSREGAGAKFVIRLPERLRVNAVTAEGTTP